MQCWPGWITTCGAVAGSSAIVQWSGPERDHDVARLEQERLAPVGQRPQPTAHDGGQRQRRLVLQPHRPRRVHQAAQQERAAGAGPVEECGQTVHADHVALDAGVWKSVVTTMDRLVVPRCAGPMNELLDTLRGPVLLAATVAAGLQAGTYYTWASGVMPGLARTDDHTFASSMNHINVAIVNPVFMLTFLGAPALAAAAVAATPAGARGWAIAGARARARHRGRHRRGQHPAQRRPRRGRLPRRLRDRLGALERRPHPHLDRRPRLPDLGGLAS